MDFHYFKEVKSNKLDNSSLLSNIFCTVLYRHVSHTTIIKPVVDHHETVNCRFLLAAFLSNVRFCDLSRSIAHTRRFSR